MDTRPQIELGYRALFDVRGFRLSLTLGVSATLVVAGGALALLTVPKARAAE